MRILEGWQGELQRNPATPASEIIYVEGVKRYYERILRSRQEGAPFAWAAMYAPIELFHAMGIAFLDIELHTLCNLYLEGTCESYLEAAAGHGFPVEICALHKVTEGMSLKRDLPAPDFVITSSQCCDLTVTFGDISRHYSRNSFILDWPFRYDEDGLNFYTREVEDLVKFLEQETGRRLDMQRLEEVMRLSEQAERLYRQIYQLKKTVPCPLRSGDGFKQMMAFYLLAGTPEGVSYFETVVQEMQAQIATGQSPAGQERFRIFLSYLPPVPYMDLLDWIEQEYGAVVVMDSLSSWWLPDRLDPADPLRSLARKGFYNVIPRQLGGPLSYWIEEVTGYIQEFRVDGAIHINHIGCKQGAAATRAVMDTLKRLNLPTMVLDLDMLDPSVTPREEVVARLEEFFERLEETQR
ncbi:MAG: 2-hydroxyacyl-CoA dehydratase [Candidatus Tectomicrobia bacterium]|uniref:2-hydroxyacyl-CoA dehydratase n=1 Tax=Tectimicrobiota bacterium TaxID=2528274 RepID=A0A932FVS9_UNCTE|nr:2-hydroxyacyl-CoA dehydratase [Candidatus Tectomicrobia bacterium]